MKDIKSVMIGFLLATCMFLFMGQTSSSSQVGRYDIESTKEDFIIVADTKTGKIVKYGYALHPMQFQNDWRKRLTEKPENFTIKWWTDLDEMTDETKD